MIVGDLKYVLQYGGYSCGCGSVTCKIKDTDILYGFLSRDSGYGYWGSIKMLYLTEESLVLVSSEEEILPNEKTSIRVKDLLMLLKKDKFGRNIDDKIVKIHSALENKIYNAGLVENRHNIGYRLEDFKTEFSGKGGAIIKVKKEDMQVRGLFKPRGVGNKL